MGALVKRLRLASSIVKLRQGWVRRNSDILQMCARLSSAS